eukprot:14095091-Alexandrium_andersonii.AAC.1
MSPARFLSSPPTSLWMMLGPRRSLPLPPDQRRPSLGRRVPAAVRIRTSSVRALLRSAQCRRGTTSLTGFGR